MPLSKVSRIRSVMKWGQLASTRHVEEAIDYHVRPPVNGCTGLKGITDDITTFESRSEWNPKCGVRTCQPESENANGNWYQSIRSERDRRNLACARGAHLAGW